MEDQPSTSADSNEPHRPKTIPDDFIWDPKIEAWYPPGEPSTFDVAAWMREFEEARRRGDFGTGGLISRDELLAAGALNVSPGKRKKLGVKREHLPLFPDDDESEDQHPQRSGEGEGDESADDDQ